MYLRVRNISAPKTTYASWLIIGTDYHDANGTLAIKKKYKKRSRYTDHPIYLTNPISFAHQDSAVLHLFPSTLQIILNMI